MANIYLIRHGETDYNVQHRICGQVEAQLTLKGHEQAENAGNELSSYNTKFDIILCSPLKRAVQTAQDINKSLNLTIVYLDGLKEVSFGSCEGLVIEEFEKEIFNQPYRCGNLLLNNGAEIRFGHLSTDPKYDVLSHIGGESKIQARERFLNCISEYLNSNPEVQNIIVVAHGAIIRFVLGFLQPNKPILVQNGEINKICYNPEHGFYL